LGKLTKKILAGLTGGADSVSRIFPPDYFRDPKGIERAKVVNIDHFRENDQTFMEKEGN
jgi:hypothetical protein